MPRLRGALHVLALVGLLVGAACGDRPPAPAGVAAARYGGDGVPEDGGVKAQRRPNVLVICLDTVRADSFAPWASGPPPCPETSAWMKAHGVAFHGASATAPWTAPSVTSLLTGLLPSGHGVRVFSDATLLPAAIPTLAEILRAQGWHATSYVAGGWVSGDTGILQGFEEENEPFSFGAMHDAIVKMQAASKALAPWFVLLHTLEAHDPYDAPPAAPGPRPVPPPVDLAAVDRAAESDGGRSLAGHFLLDWATRPVIFDNALGRPRVEAVMRYFEKGFRADPEKAAFAATAHAAYLRGLARLDRWLAVYLKGAEAAGVLDGTILVLCADHGEGFGEHDTLHHGRRLYDELLRVPLYVCAPGLAPGTVVEGSCSLADVVPTILDLVGLPPPEGIEGRTLLPVARGGPGRPVLAEERRTASETGFPVDEHLVSVRDARWKWIRTTDLTKGTSREESYDLSADPGETVRLAPAAATWSAAFGDAVRRAKAIR